MKKLLQLFCTLPLSLLFVFGACAAETPRDDPGKVPSPPGSSEIQNDDQENDEETPPKDDAKPGLWDTSAVDISHIRSERLIAFTFDDGPKEETAELLDVFAQFNEANPDWQAHATLFILGGNIDDTNKSVLTRACESGMELGNHSFSHPNLTTLSDSALSDEIGHTDALLQEIDGRERHLIRPPGGHYDDRVLSSVEAPCINWTGALDTSDWSGVTENDIYNTISSNLIDGGIVLMHQGIGETVDAVKRLLPDLKKRGFQVVSVSELAKAYGLELYAGQAYSYLG